MMPRGFSSASSTGRAEGGKSWGGRKREGRRPKEGGKEVRRRKEGRKKEEEVKRSVTVQGTGPRWCKY
jgi:hypothetical protein